LSGKCWKKREICGFAHPEGGGKTKPIARSGTPRQCLDCRFQPRIGVRGDKIADWGQASGGTPALRPGVSGLRGPTVQNEPNFGGAGRDGASGTRGNCAKRTQFRDRGRASGVDPGKRSQFPAPAGAVRRARDSRCLRGSQLRKTNPIWLGSTGGRVPLGPKVQNEANLGPGGGRGTGHAKRTQFRGVGRPVEYPAFHYSIIPPFQSDAVRAKQSQSPTVPGFGWPLSRLRAIMAARRWAGHQRN
jgi:hypothetical protein